MIDNKPFAMFFNASPRKCWNTHKMLEAANIFTMNCPREMMEKIGYPTLLEANTDVLKTVFGASETLYACNTYQFADYSRYDFNLFTEEEKRAYRDAHFDEDLAAARALGRRLTQQTRK